MLGISSLNLSDLMCKMGIEFINADIPVKKYPQLFLIVRNRDARVADYIEFWNGCVFWAPIFCRVRHAWELNNI